MERITEIKVFLASISTLPECAMRRHSIRRYLETHDDDEAAWVLGQILRLTLKDPALNDALIATCGTILDFHLDQIRRQATREIQTAEPYLTRLRKSAIYQELKEVSLWLAQAAPERMLGEGAKLPPVNILPDGSPVMRNKKPAAEAPKKPDEVTSGHRRALARHQNPKLLSHLLMDPDPHVLEIILQNRVLRLQDVLTIAARRPTTPDLLLEVVKNQRWFRYEEIREALILNPYGYTQIGLSLLPSLSKIARRRVSQSGELHYFIGNFCSILKSLE